MPRTARHTLVCVAVLATVAAGCARRGDDDVLVTAAKAAPDPRSATDRQADMVTAKAMALTRADLPDGWKVGSQQAVAHLEGKPPAGGRFGACMHLTPAEFGGGVPGFHSPSFTDTVGTQIRINVDLMASAEAGAHQLALFKVAGAPECFARAVLQGGVSRLSGATADSAKGVAVPIEPMGDAAVQFHLTMRVTSANGVPVTVMQDVQMVLAGRAYITAVYQREPLYAPVFDAALARRLTRKVVDRAPTA